MTAPSSVLEALIGWPPFTPPLKDSKPDISNPRVVEELRRWLTTQDIPASAAYGDPTYKLANAYASQRYLDAWRNGIPKDKWRKKEPFRPTPNLVNWDDGGRVDGGRVEPEPKAPPHAPPNGHDDKPLVDSRLDSATLMKLIVDSVNAVVGSKLDNLGKLAHEAARLELEQVQLGESTKSVIRALARETASAVALDLLPRRIELDFGRNTPPRILDAEPRHSIFDDCLRWLASGENLYLVGPAGTGKTHLAKQLATALNSRFLPMSPAMTRYEFSGFIDGSGSYRGTIFRDAVENGGTLVLDEIDGAAAAAIMFLNSVLANGYCAFPDRVVEAHPDFKVIAAANTFGRGATMEYQGRNPLDAASIDRFVYLICDYDEALERAIFGPSPWLEYIHKVRKAVLDLKLRHIVSMRAISRAIRGSRAGFDPSAIAHAALWRGLDRDTISKLVAIAGAPPRAHHVGSQAENIAENIASRASSTIGSLVQ